MNPEQLVSPSKVATNAKITTELMAIELSQRQFEKISELTYRICGISLQAGKEGLVKSRLTKRLRALGMVDFDQYLKHLETDSTRQELAIMVDTLTTNKTSFFREAQHFDYLRSQILPYLATRERRLRLWSAGCSSGEEPYSLAITLKESLAPKDNWDARILATDISRRVLQKAKEAVYDQEAVAGVPAPWLTKYFTCVRPQAPRSYQVNSDVRQLVRLAQLNLMGEWPMRGPFDAIFCRNVMIYFDKPTQQRLVQRFWELLAPGGHLFVGHSESLTGSVHSFRYVQPAVYVK